LSFEVAQTSMDCKNCSYSEKAKKKEERRTLNLKFLIQTIIVWCGIVTLNTSKEAFRATV